LSYAHLINDGKIISCRHESQRMVVDWFDVRQALTCRVMTTNVKFVGH